MIEVQLHVIKIQLVQLQFRSEIRKHIIRRSDAGVTQAPRRSDMYICLVDKSRYAQVNQTWLLQRASSKK